MGNDAVDLMKPGLAGKAADRRFLERVLTERERAAVLTAEDPDVTLWMAWAAKEAAFKAVSKASGAPPVFAHADFRVDLPPGDPVVRYRDRIVPFLVRGGRGAGALHVVAWEGRERPRIEGGSALLDEEPPERDRLSARELRAVHSPASALVRLKARGHLASLAGVPEEELEIVCDGGPVGRAPPRVLHRGGSAPWDVSLSHHGRIVAWTVALSPSPGSSAPEPRVPEPARTGG